MDIKPTILDGGFQIILQTGPAIEKLCAHTIITFQ